MSHGSESPARSDVGFGLRADRPRRWRAISVRITAEEHALLRTFAAARGQTISDAVRAVLTAALQRTEPEQLAQADRVLAA